jgi:ADP-ribosylglycohydrolase
LFNEKYKEQIYSGVLGKIIGVYLGRPVEGWTHEKIVSKLGDVRYYVNEKTGAPLIVPDDDISGTFAFFRALEDNGYSGQISSKSIGNTWLNYIIENKTILWWGGLSRSTEHTAFLRLKEGIDAPRSGSSELNGESMATQIGAQIFIDAWAMANPANPERTAYMAREAARVSHDSIAVEAAVYLAVMQSMAFEERSIDVLLEEAKRYIRGGKLVSLIEEIRSICVKSDNWQSAREYIAQNHGYDKYLGNCPMVTNHLVVLMALILGEDNFQKSIHIAASAAWDTDCNAANVGCLNGIRLGLDGINAGADFRGPISDRILMVSSDGGSCISDAVIESRKIIKAAAALDNIDTAQPDKRFAFEFPGSTQGFMVSNDITLGQAVTSVENAGSVLDRSGLIINYHALAYGVTGAVCVDTYTDLNPKGIEGTSYFEVLASPSLYATQTVETIIEGLHDNNPDIVLYIQYYNSENGLEKAYSPKFSLKKGKNTLIWKLPDTNGFPIYRIGIELSSDKRLDGLVNLVSMDWSNEPEQFHMPRSYEMSPSLTPWTTSTTWLKSFMSSALNFHPDYTSTFSLSHPVENGIVTIGSTDWKDYSISSKIIFMQHKGAGLVVRSKGHRRYYAALIQGTFARIIKVKDREVIVLAEVDSDYQIDSNYHLEFRVCGNKLVMKVNGEAVLSVDDSEYSCGGSGFVVNEGAILIDRFSINAIKKQEIIS